MTSFKIDTYISHVSVSSIRWVFVHFIDVFQKNIRGDGRKRTRFDFFILQKHNVLLILRVYTNKSRTFTISNDVLILSVQSKMMELLFAVIRKKMQVIVQVVVLVLL